MCRERKNIYSEYRSYEVNDLSRMDNPNGLGKRKAKHVRNMSIQVEIC